MAFSVMPRIDFFMPRVYFSMPGFFMPNIFDGKVFYAKDFYANLNMAFSVMPRRAVTAARMKTASPVNTWTGRRAFRRCDARPEK